MRVSGAVVAIPLTDARWHRLEVLFLAVLDLPPPERTGFIARETSERFRFERQVLAGLEHPNIARFLDGGTEDGVPYCVMEYVDGAPIDAFCDRRGLDLRARLSLFRQVCGAVHFAHESLVSFSGSDWLVANPDGLFDGSPNGWKQVHWRFSGG